MRRWPPDRRPFAAAAVLALLPGCGLGGWLFPAEPQPRAGLRSVPLDVAYGPEETAAAQALPAAPAPQAAVPFLEDIFRVATGPSFPSVRFTPVFEPCPQAPDDLFPAHPAPPDVAGTPAAGTYPWFVSGPVEYTGLFKTTLNRAPILRRVGSLDVRTDGSFQYDVTTTSATGQQIETIEVIPGSEIRLTRLQNTSPKGTKTDFAPVTPVQIVALPVTPGATIGTVPSVDPVSGRTIQVTGRVRGHRRLDVCGRVIDSWQVETTRTDQTVGAGGSRTTPSTYNYSIVTDRGGLIMADYLKVQGTDADGTVYSAELTAQTATLEPR